MSAIWGIDFEMQHHVRTYLHGRLHYKENIEIAQHEPPTQDAIALFLVGKHSGPCLDDLHLYFEHIASDWNKKAALLLRREFCEDYLGKMDGVPPREEEYHYDLIFDQLERLAKIWRKSRPRRWIEDGVEIIEDPSMVEARMNLEKETDLKTKRHTTRRISVST